MGFNPFKSIKKIVKKIGKGIKKLGKGLKKVMGKIMKPFAKLGVIGQIGLGMLMPWAIGGIFGGLTSSTFASFAGNLVSNGNLFGKMAGRLMQGVHWGATKIQGAYSSVTEALSSGFENMTNKAKELFGVNADASDILTQDVDQITPSVSEEIVKEEVTEKVVDKSFTEKFVDETKEAILDIPSKLVDTGIREGSVPDVAYSAPVSDFLGANTNYTTYNERDLVREEQNLQNQGGMYGGLVHGANVQLDTSFGQDAYFSFLQGVR